MGVPCAAGLRLHVGETSARWRIGDANEVVAARALNLPAGELRFALQWLVTVGTVEFEFVRAHRLHHHHAPNGCEKHIKN
jgi:hypothetical protein